MKLQFKTTRFGTLEVDKDRIIQFPQGIPGFSHIKNYVLLDHKDTPLKWLQAVDDPDVAFLVVEPSIVVSDYSISIDDKTRELIELEREEDLAVLLIIRVEGQKVIANLQGPLVLNAAKMKGIQMIIE
jgi:flagellar assembly factor FliW